MIIINHGLGHPGLGIMVILVILVQIFIKVIMVTIVIMVIMITIVIMVIMFTIVIMVIMVKQVDKGVHGHHHQPPPVSNGVDQAIKEVD